MDGVEGEVGKDGAVVGNGREDACFCVVWMVGEEKVEEVVVASGSADGFSEVEVLADFVEAAAEWGCGGVGEAEPLSVVDVEVAEEKSADVVGGVVGEFGFEGVEAFEGVGLRAVEETEEKRTGGGVDGEPEALGGRRFFEGVGGDGVVASVDDDATMVRRARERVVARAVAAGERCVVGDGERRDGVVEPGFGESEDVGFVDVEVRLEFGKFSRVDDGLGVEEEKREELLRE